MRGLFVVVALVALSGCVDLLNATVPNEGYRVERNIAYGPEPRQKLDIYMPDKRAAGAPVIVFFYGGRWRTGTKDDYLFVGQALASKGITVVVADYRLYPNVRFPVFVEDGARAIRWAHDHIAAYQGNPKNVFLTGHSAGAYIAVMLAVNDSFIKAAGGESSWLKGAVGIAGPYDFLPFTDEDIKDMFSTASGQQTQPINFIRKGAPPLLLVTGDEDEDVKPRNTYSVAEKSTKSGNVAEVRTYPGVGHIGIILSLTDFFQSKAPLLNDIAQFVEKYKN